jgi:hypothetical protein
MQHVDEFFGNTEFPLSDKKLVKNILANKRSNTELLFECFAPVSASSGQTSAPDTPVKDKKDKAETTKEKGKDSKS